MLETNSKQCRGYQKNSEIIGVFFVLFFKISLIHWVAIIYNRCGKLMSFNMESRTDGSLPSWKLDTDFQEFKQTCKFSWLALDNYETYQLMPNTESSSTQMYVPFQQFLFYVGILS